VGYAALQATLGAADWQTDTGVELTITTATLDGEPQDAEGSLKIIDSKTRAGARPPLVALLRSV